MRIVIDMQGAQSTASRHPQEQIVVWQTPGPVADANPENRWRREQVSVYAKHFAPISSRM
jgi:hypothetical protein